MARMTGGEALARALVAQGVDTLFVLPGVQNDPLFSALYDLAERLRVIVTRHEQGAAYMAHGYAAATGRPGAVRRNWVHISGTGTGAVFQPDDTGATITLASLQALATAADPITFMAVPAISDVRMGIDRDEDGALNATETSLNSDNQNPLDNMFVDADFAGLPDGTASAPFTTVTVPCPTVTRAAVIKSPSNSPQRTCVAVSSQDAESNSHAV